MKHSKEVYLELLNKFTVPHSMLRDWMRSPFSAEGKTISTNGVVLMVCPPQDGDYKNHEDRLVSVYPRPHSMSIEIKVSDLEMALMSAPQVELFDEKEEINECDACDGTGEVEYEFWHNKTYSIMHDCPVCAGEGVIVKEIKIPTGKMGTGPKAIFQISGSFFITERIVEILFVAEKLNTNTITLVNQNSKEAPSLFVVDDCEMIVMPAITEDDRDAIKIPLLQ